MAHNIKFTKFFDVQSPIAEAIDGSFNNAGIDVYFPRPTVEFIQGILSSNKDLLIIQYNYNDKTNYYDSFVIVDKSENKIFLTFVNGIYKIYKTMQIPTGIGLLIPAGYHVDLRSKSGLFKNGYTEITGLIDNIYTYGMGVQIVKFPEQEIVEIKTDQKFAQFVMLKTEEITQMEEVKQVDWNNLDEVKLKRNMRTGGFGSTGNFVKEINQ